MKPSGQRAAGGAEVEVDIVGEKGVRLATRCER